MADTTDLSDVPVDDIEGARERLDLPEEASNAEVTRTALREIQHETTPVATADLAELAEVIEEANEEAIEDTSDTLREAVRDGVEEADGDLDERELAHEIANAIGPSLQSAVHSELLKHNVGGTVISDEVRRGLEDAITNALPVEDGAMDVRVVDE